MKGQDKPKKLGKKTAQKPLKENRAQNKAKTELLVMITPRLVQPLAPGQTPAAPAFPQPFLDPQDFDGTSGGSSSSTTPGAGQ